MTEVVQEIRAELKRRTAKAQADYRDLLQSIAQEKTDINPEAAAQIVAAAGKTLDRLDSDVALVSELSRHESLARRLDDIQSHRRRLATFIEELEGEFASYQQTKKRELDQLREEYQQETSRENSAHSALSEVERIRRELAQS